MAKSSLAIAYQCAYNITSGIKVKVEDINAFQQAASCWRNPLETSLGILPCPFQYYSTRLEQIIFNSILNQVGRLHSIHMIKLWILYFPLRGQLHLQVLWLDLEDFICTFQKGNFSSDTKEGKG